VFPTKPDIVGLLDGKPVWIIDTKWKPLDKEERKQGVAQADVYQMLGYARRYGVGNVFLLYPHRDRMEADAGLQRSFHVLGEYISSAVEMGGQRIHVATVDLADLDKVPNQLRSILEHTTEAQSEIVEWVL
jgi:5-methylcytosine-specific restriction enzyme subunit McrC